MNKEHEPQINGKDMFGFITGIFYLAIMCLSAPWSLLTRRLGSIGARTYWMDFLWHNMLLLMLRIGLPMDWPVYDCVLVAMPVAMLLQFVATLRNKSHVHSYCIGTPWFDSEFLCWALGIGLAAGAYHYLTPSIAIYCASISTATAVQAFMVKERDRHRTLAMQNAMWEQQQMMSLYELHKKG